MSHSLKEDLQQTREMLDAVSSRKCLPDIRQMLASIGQSVDEEELKADDLYPLLYQFLCASAHARFQPDRYLQDEGGVLKRVDRPAMPPLTPAVVLTSAYCMAKAVFILFGCDYGHLKAAYHKALQSVHRRLTEES